MVGYTEGKHNDPADTQDRLVRIGSKYQASAPAVADGDNVYLLVDAAGRPLIVGAAAHDAAAVGNPLRVGGVYRTTLPGVAAADMVDILMSAEGRPRVEEYLIQQARLGNGKFTTAQVNKSTTAGEDVATWTVTNGKTGYLVAVEYSWESISTETRIEVAIKNDGTSLHTQPHAPSKDTAMENYARTIYLPVPAKIVGDGSKAFTLQAQQNTTGTTRYSASLWGWEE